MKSGYFATAARRAGVPDNWLDEAVQDIAFRVWRAPDVDWRVVVRRAAIDAAREYGWHTRMGGMRLSPLTIDWPYPGYRHPFAHDDYEQVDKAIDMRLAWRKLTANQRRGILATMRGHATNLQQKHASLGRQKLRRLCA